MQGPCLAGCLATAQVTYCSSAVLVITSHDKQHSVLGQRSSGASIPQGATTMPGQLLFSNTDHTIKYMIHHQTVE
jgi:hypothetical protein